MAYQTLPKEIRDNLTSLYATPVFITWQLLGSVNQLRTVSLVNICPAQSLVSYYLSQDQLGVHSKTAITWVGAIRPFVKTKSSVNTSISVVSIVSHRLKTQFKLNPVRQKISDRYPYFAGKFTSQLKSLFDIFVSYPR